MFKPLSRSMHLQGVELNADLRLPTNTGALVVFVFVFVFVHGSGSARLSPRNQYSADVLAHRGLGSLLFDLLTETEQRLDNLTGELRFNIPFLARRLIDVIDWAGRDRQLCLLRIGLFGASIGGGGRACAGGRGRGQPGWADRPGGAGAGPGKGTDVADCWRKGPGGVR